VPWDALRLKIFLRLLLVNRIALSELAWLHDGLRRVHIFFGLLLLRIFSFGALLKKLVEFPLLEELVALVLSELVNFEQKLGR